MARAHIGLGANLGDPAAQLHAALDAIAALPATRLARRSSFYRTAPVGRADQPDFLNAVAAIETELAPSELLVALQAIEHRAGRERPFPNAPRTLDLDLLLYADRVVRESGLEIPHPRMHRRAFVLVPLIEIEPAIEIPGHGRADACLARIRDQRVDPS